MSVVPHFLYPSSPFGPIFFWPWWNGTYESNFHVDFFQRIHASACMTVCASVTWLMLAAFISNFNGAIMQVSIPVVPTVRVVITFTKFEDLPPVDQFFTPLSSPSLFHTSSDEDEHVHDSSWNSWLRRPSYGVGSRSVNRKTMPIKPCEQDPFAIPANYAWTTIADIKRRRTKEKKPKSKKAK